MGSNGASFICMTWSFNTFIGIIIHFCVRTVPLRRLHLDQTRVSFKFVVLLNDLNELGLFRFIGERDRDCLFLELLFDLLFVVWIAVWTDCFKLPFGLIGEMYEWVGLDFHPTVVTQ